MRKTDKADKRKGALKHVSNKLSEDERNKVLQIVNSREFASLPPSQIVPTLADRGEYICSESSFYRILRAEGMQHYRGRSRSPQKKICPRLTASRPNQIYSWDITYLPTHIKGQFYYLYLFIDIFSRFIVGWHIDICQDSEISANIFRRICKDRKIKDSQLTLHSDNGGAMKGVTMLAMMHNLGVIKSFSRPATSNDNPFSEALFKTVKYCPAYPRKPFQGIVEAKSWMQKFVAWYNYEHKHSGINFVTPYQKSEGLDIEVLQKRTEVYQKAKNKRPERWGRSIRKWNPISVVHINPL